jgi:hypothetical protein
VKFEDGSSTSMSPHEYDQYVAKGKALGADMKDTRLNSRGGPSLRARGAYYREGQASKDKSKRVQGHIGTAALSDKR